MSLISKIKKFISLFLAIFSFASCIDTSLVPKKGNEEVPVEDVIKLSHSDVSIDLNSTFLLNIIDPEEINYHWYSGNTSVLCALGEGTTCNVMGVGVGESYVKVKDDTGRETICTVVVSNYSEIEIVSTSATLGNQEEYVGVDSLTISQNSITLAPKETTTLGITISPSKAISYNDMFFVSTDPNVADIYEGGLVFAKNIGYATINVICGGKTASCEVAVEESQSDKVESIEGITPSLTFSGKKTQEFTYTILPTNLVNVNLEISISNENVMKVSNFSLAKKIVFSSVNAGSCLVTIKCGNQSVFLPFTVREVYITSVSATVTNVAILANNKTGSDRFYTLIGTVTFQVYPFNAFGEYLSISLEARQIDGTKMRNQPDGWVYDANIGSDGITRPSTMDFIRESKINKFTHAKDKTTTVVFSCRPNKRINTYAEVTDTVVVNFANAPVV